MQLFSLAMQFFNEIIANNTKISLGINFTPFNRRNLINTPLGAYIVAPFAVSAPFDVALPRHGFEGFFLESEAFFCGNFYSARPGTNRGEIKDSPWKMDHENVMIHFPLSNYVIK